MEKIIKIGKHIYLSGLYQMRSVESNYANPCEFPTIFVAFWAGIKSGNWQSCTSINTPDQLVKYFNENGYNYRSNYDIVFKGLSQSENYELHGLIFAIATLAEAYGVVRFGNHGTHEGKDIKNIEVARSVFNHIKPVIERANELLSKIKPWLYQKISKKRPKKL